MQMICNVDIMRFGTKVCNYKIFNWFQFKMKIFSNMIIYLSMIQIIKI